MYQLFDSAECPIEAGVELLLTTAIDFEGYFRVPKLDTGIYRLSQFDRELIVRYFTVL